MIDLITVTAADLQQEMISMLKTKFPEWTDQQYSNNMIMFLEVVAAVAELNYGYINYTARECFLITAVDPRNVEQHAKGLGYTPKPQTSAQVDAVLTTDMPVTATTTIPAGTKFNTVLPNVFYETTVAVSILAGQTSTGAVTLKQWESWTTSFSGTGAANQKILLDYAPVLPGTVVVTINGTPWTKVDNFVESNSLSQHFMVFSDVQGNSAILFGDGVLGKCPTLGSLGSISYKTGGGRANSISVDQLLQTVSEVHDAGNNRILGITAYNALAAEPGTDRETIDQMKTNTVLNLKAPRALLTKSDVKEAVLGFPGVQACKVINWEDNPVLPHYMLQVFVKPLQDTPVPANLRNLLNQLLTVDKPVVIGQVPTVMDPVYKYLDFDFTVVVESGYGVTETRAAVELALADLFNVNKPNIWKFTPDFEMLAYSSKIVAALQAVPGVQSIVMNAPGDIQCGYTEFPLLRSVVLR